MVTSVGSVEESVVSLVSLGEPEEESVVTSVDSEEDSVESL